MKNILMMSKLDDLLNNKNSEPEFKIQIYNKEYNPNDDNSELYLNNETCPKRIKDFLEDVVSLCKKHNLTISHEDGHGAFIIEEYDKFNLEWLHQADINIKDE